MVTVVDLRRGSIIQDNDIHMAPLDITDVRNPCFNLDEVIGKKVKRTVRRGQALDRRTIEFPPMIHRGELVTLIARKGALTVTARGVAKHDAKKDAMIKIQNNNSQKEIIGRVSAPGLVMVGL